MTSHEANNRSRAPAVVGAVVVSLAAGIAAGVAWHGAILRALHRDARPAAADGGRKQLWTCGMHPQVIRDQPGLCPICQMKLEPLDAVQAGHSAMTGGAAGAAVTIDPVVVQNMGVRVAPVTRGPVRQQIRAVGSLDVAQPNVRDVNLRVSGWVEKLYADTVGVALSKGAPLFDLYSPEVQVAVEELIAARKAAASAGTDPAAGRTASTLFEATRQKLEQWGLDPRQVEKLAQLDRAPRAVTFTSPVDGFLTEKTVVQGAAVKSGDMALRIVDLSTIWLDAQVYAQDLPFISLGQEAAAEVEGVPGKRFAGKVVFVHPQVDPQTRTATVRMALDNKELALRPGLYATAQIRAELADDALLVPREAVLDTGARQLVFVSQGQGRFTPRSVTLGAAGEEGTVQVLEGLAEGESVVTSGQFLLDAESRMREAIQKHLDDRMLSVARVAPAPGTKPSDLSRAAQTPPPPPPASPATAAASSEVDAVFVEYLALQRALGLPQEAEAPLDPARLVKAAEALAGGPDAGNKAAALVRSAASTLAGQQLSEQRKLFKPLSEAVIALAESNPPSTAAAQTLFIAFCPMAPGEGARWLQTTDAIANPYFATSMKNCGEIRGRIATVPPTTAPSKAGPR